MVECRAQAVTGHVESEDPYSFQGRLHPAVHRAGTDYHSLAVEQREGISVQRVAELYALVVRGPCGIGSCGSTFRLDVSALNISLLRIPLLT
jgi:hypothetical protein